MKQLAITSEIKSAAKKYADNLFVDKGDKFVQPVDALKNLITDLNEVNDELEHRDCYIKYLEEIIKDYDKIKSLLPSKFKRYKKKYDKILKDDLLSVKIKHRGMNLPSKPEERLGLDIKNEVFYMAIVERMHYKDTRPYLGPLMEHLGINTCVYCNIYPAFSSEKKEEVYYPFDHYMPKEKYPFLSICFYNLNPICPECNGHKLNNDGKGYQLYVEQEPVRDPFVFVIEMNKIVDGDPKTVKVDFEARQDEDKTYAEQYDEWYRITEYYNYPSEKRSHYKMIQDIKKHIGSYPKATEDSFRIKIDRKKLFLEVFGIEDDDKNIFTDLKKKLMLDTAKDSKLI